MNLFDKNDDEAVSNNKTAAEKKLSWIMCDYHRTGK